MAGILGTLSVAGTGVSTGTSAKTVLQIIAASNHRVKVTGWGISFNGTTANDPRIQVDLLYQTTAGTVTSASPQKRGEYTETLQTTGGKNATAEPTTDYVLRSYYVDPEWGYTELLGTDNEIIIAGGGRLAIRTTATNSVTCFPWFDFEE